MSETELSFHDLIKEAKQAEADADFKKAATLYEAAIKRDDKDFHLYDRLMIIYRKQQLYKKELSTINKAIKNITQLHKQKSHTSKNKTITTLSNALMKSTGLIDKKGKMLYKPQPILKWEKRKITVEKKLNKT